ncbi:MAG: type I CRISPR-associated protein Cas7, partial [Thermodesulfobacteriota bacterium]
PRTIDTDEHGLISPVSFKRKIRDIVAEKDGDAWRLAKGALKLEEENDKRTILVNTRSGLGAAPQIQTLSAKYNILETRFRQRDAIKKMDAFAFNSEFRDARIFGNTFLESLKEENEEPAAKEKGKKDKAKKQEERESRDHFISTGVVQFGPGVSIAPISVIRNTWTNKPGVQGGMDQGMAPMAWKVVQHAVYAMPFFVNPCMAQKTGCELTDINLMKFFIPHAYTLNQSVVRPFVEIRHAWYAEHKTPLGSCPDSLILDALTPKKIKGDPGEPSTSIEEYEIPMELPADVIDRLKNFEDLCQKEW